MSRLLIVLFLSVSAIYAHEKSFITLLKVFQKKKTLTCANIVCLLQIFDQIVRPRREKDSTVVLSFMTPNGQDQQVYQDIFLCHDTAKTIWKGSIHEWVLLRGVKHGGLWDARFHAPKHKSVLDSPFQCWHANFFPLVMFFLFWPYMLTIQWPWT